MPIGNVGNPNFCDFRDPKDSPFAQTRQVLAKLRDTRKSSLDSDFRRKFNLSLNHRVRDMGIEDCFFPGKLFISTKRTKGPN